MKPEDLELIGLIVQSRTGFVVDLKKGYLIENRLGPLARREGFETASDLIVAIRTKRDDRLIWALADAMTPKDTAFFRDRTPFAQFRETLAPALAKDRGSNPIRVWSAGCSTGQEAYSLAMTVNELRAEHPGIKVEITGSDLSERCLDRAQSGLFSQLEVQKGLPVRQLVRYFEKQDDMWLLSSQIRQMVRWRRLNLIADLGLDDGYDVIFCRYLLNGLDRDTRQKVLNNLASALNDNGYLIVGRDEAVLDPVLVPVGGLSDVYRREAGHRGTA